MERKCSVCGSPMVQTNAGYKCNFCANVEPLDVTSPVASNSMQRTDSSASASMDRQKKKSIVLGVILAIVGMIILSFSMVFFPLLGLQLSRGEQPDSGIDWRDYEDDEEDSDEVDKDGFASATMGQIIYKIFGKNASEVTREELDTIQYIELSGAWVNDQVVFRYSTEDYRDYKPDTWDGVPEYNEYVPFSYTEEFKDTFRTVTVQFLDSNASVVYEDLDNFKNVRGLCLTNYTSVNLSKMPNLSMIICNNTNISTLLKAGVPVDQIEVLHAYYVDLAGIEEFTALKRLYLENNKFEQMEEVVNCESLEELYCIDLKDDKSFEILSKMPNLKLLYIDGLSDALKDLSVLAQLTSLESLTIVDTEIMKVDFLKELENLKVLRLADNGKLEDLSVLGELTNLEYLELDVNAANGGQPDYQSVGKLKNLRKLLLNTVYELDFLYELEQLEELEIDLTFYNNLLEPIRQMKNLESLSLLSCHSQYKDGFACLRELPQLKYLRIEDMEFDEPVDGLFALENLEELHIHGCDIYVAPASVKVSDSLKVLELTSTDFRVMPGSGEYVYVGYDDPEAFQGVLNQYFKATSLEELYLDWCVFENLSGLENLSNLEILSLNWCDLMELPGTDLSGCDSLRELYLAGNELSNIEFVKNLPALEYIDIQGCYVTDIMPLKYCKNLQYANVKENPTTTESLAGVELVTD